MPATRSRLGVIFLTVLIDLIGFGIIMPILPMYAQRFGAQGIGYGALVFVFSAMQFLATALLGRLSDRIGRRPILLTTMVINALGYALFAFAPSYAVLFVARVISGFASGNISAAQAYMADITSPGERARRPLRGSPRARAHRRRAVGRQLLLGERHLAGVARRRAPHGAAVVRFRSHGGSACSKAAAAADACMVPRAVRLRGLHRGPAAAHRQGVRLGSEGAGLAVRPDRCDRRAGSGLPVRSDRAAHGRARLAHRRVVRDGSEHRGAAVGRQQSPGVRLDRPARVHEQPVRTRRVGSRVPLRGPYGTGHDPRGRAGVRRAGPQLRPARRWVGVRRARPAKHVPPRGRGDAAGWTGGAMAEESGGASD